jgi:putative transcriptional regulator
MTSKVAESIRRGLEEALAYAEGTADTSRYGVHIPEDIDVKAIRAKLDMTQEEFAGRFGFSVNTLRHWEQGRRVPEGPTRAYLLVIDRNPKAVQKALKAARRPVFCNAPPFTCASQPRARPSMMSPSQTKSAKARRTASRAATNWSKPLSNPAPPPPTTAAPNSNA